MEKKSQSPKKRPPQKDNSSEKQDVKDAVKDSRPLSGFARYSGMGIQMIVVILIFYWAGSKLDERSPNEKPIFTAIFTLLGVFAGLYLALRDFIFPGND